MALGSSSGRDGRPAARQPRARWWAAALLGTAAAALAWVALAPPAAGQYIRFGKNKVNYREFDWRVLQSEHFDLYYYPEEEEFAQLALAAAERSYDHHRQRFWHEIDHRIPIILYSSQHDFEQTNITPMLIPEGVGGLTETMRGRVLMPFDGSLYDFRRTLQHELVHAFQLSLGETVYRDHYRRRMPSPPLWFIEGMAEHWSREWDADADLILRDLVISGNLPALDEFWRYDGSFAMYKLGQSVLAFLAQEYGDDKVVQFYRELWKVGSFRELYPRLLGVDQRELSERWAHWLRRRYYPDVLRADPIIAEAQRIPIWGTELKPTPVPAGVLGDEDVFLFVSPQSGYDNIYLAQLDPDRARGSIETVIEGQRSAEYLSFHAFHSRLDVSAEGVLLFSSHRGDRDQLIAYDLVSREVVGSWRFDELVGITSPQWDRAGRQVVFSGLRRDGYQDLYLLDATTGALERLTRDRHSDREPAIHPDGRWIAFVSDRGAQGSPGARNLFLYDRETSDIWQLTRGDGWDLSPSWSPDGEWLLFASTRDGLRDLYVVDRQGRGGRVTRSLQAILDPRWLPSGREVLGTAYKEGRFETVRIPIAPEQVAPTLACEVRRLPREGDQPAIPVPAIERRESYKTTFALDAAQGGVAVDPGLGSGEGLQLLLRDLMGNQLIFFQIGNTTISTRDFLDNFSAGITYLDLSRRLNRGFSVYHHAGNYYDELRVPFFERRVGATGLLSYPLSRFTRLETSLGLAYAEKDKPSTQVERHGAVATHYLSWIHDTALWLPTGPIDGRRMHLTLGMTMNLRRPGVENVLLLADARRYLRLSRRSALALRLQMRASGGPDPQVFLLGGSHSLRGYPWRQFHGTRAALANVECRFPLIRRFLIDPALVGPLLFPGIEGALFCDAGQAWYDDWPARWRGSYGLGLRMGLGGLLVLRYDLARRTDFRDWPRETYSEFFVGWNY